MFDSVSAVSVSNVLMFMTFRHEGHQKATYKKKLAWSTDNSSYILVTPYKIVHQEATGCSYYSNECQMSLNMWMKTKGLHVSVSY